MKNLQALWSRFLALSDEDRKKAVAVALSVILLLIVTVIWSAASSLSHRHAEVVRLRSSLKQIDVLSSSYNQIKANQQTKDALIRSNDVALFTLIQNSASRLGLQINDLNERKEPIADSEMMQVSVVVTIKELSIDRLTAFLEDIENSAKNGLVKITRLQVKTRFDQPDLLDVQMTVSTWKAG